MGLLVADDGVKIAINFLDWLLSGEVHAESRVPCGHGAILCDGIKLIAVYRDSDGNVDEWIRSQEG